ncbi:MAG: LysR family transcriptional regulator [Pygmaiobacter massiliensis]|nr:LysR family transcriptional regulator [Pygmaiobacter massiliensis]
MLDFRVDTFLEVCRQMNYTKAAQVLALTQPAVSQHIRWLEEQYQVQLFTYANKRLALTPEGEQLRNMALTMKQDTQTLKNGFHQPGPLAHKLVMGVTPTVGMYLVPKQLARYHARWPQSPITVKVANTRTLCAALDEGELDFAIVEGYYDRTRYEALPYLTDPYLAVCASGYTFAKQPKKLSDLLGQTLIVREIGSGNREIIRRALSRENLAVEDFHSLIEVNDMNVLKELLLLGCGVGFLYQAAARPELLQKKLRVIALEDFKESYNITFLWRKGSQFAERYRALYPKFLPQQIQAERLLANSAQSAEELEK